MPSTSGATGTSPTADNLHASCRGVQIKLGITTRGEVHAAYATDNPATEPDRIILRFVEEYAGLEGKGITPLQTAKLIGQVAENYPTQPRMLDHAIWRQVSGREIFRADELN